jgi:signal transduction histidine kinase
MLKFNDLSLVVAMVYLAQAVVGVTLFFIFRYFSKLYQQRFLTAWSVSWVLFSVSMVAFFFLTGGFARMPASQPLGMFISWLSITFSYMHIFMLIVGTYELLDMKFAQKKVIWWLLGIAMVSLVIVFLFSQTPAYSAHRYFLRVGIRYGITAISFIAIGVVLLRKKQPGIGFKLMSGSMIFYGVLQSYYSLVVVGFVAGMKVVFPSLFGIIDLILMSGIGLGMLIGLLENERAKLQKANTEMDSFIYSTSHDLRAPIASILGLTNLAKVELTDETALKYFEMVENRVNKMDMVISDILQLARSTKADLQLEPIDFNKLLQDVIADVKFNKGAKKIRLEYTPNASHQFVSDYNQSKIILGNLIGNAVKYHHHEQPDPFIAVRFGATASEIVIEVEDNGSGIAKQHQEKIFNMFYRASTQSDGTGLGLYIVKEAISKLNGSIVLASEKDKGSIFTVRLPKAKL